MGDGGMNHHRGVSGGRLDERWARRRWLDSRGHCWVSENWLQWVVSQVKDGRWEGRGRGVCWEAVTLRLHWSEEIHVLQTERQNSQQRPLLLAQSHKHADYSDEIITAHKHSIINLTPTFKHIPHKTHSEPQRARYDRIIIRPVAFTLKVTLAF